MEKGLSWQIARRDNETTVEFHGVLDESSSFVKLGPLAGSVTFDLGGVRRVTSGGVTQWIRFLDSLGTVTRLTFVNCSVAMVTQLNMIRGFRGRGEVRSFFAPYVCPSSGKEIDCLLRVEDVTDQPPELDSPEGKLVFNDVPSRYFAFLARATKTR